MAKEVFEVKSPEEIKYTLHWCWNRETNNQCIECPYKNEDCGRTLETDALAYIQQLEQRLVEANETSPRWISVRERMPEPDQDVLLIAHGWKGQLQYIGRLRHMEAETSWLTGITSMESEWSIEGWSYLKTPFVTYWMPLPEPPKEGK